MVRPAALAVYGHRLEISPARRCAAGPEPFAKGVEAFLPPLPPFFWARWAARFSRCARSALMISSAEGLDGQQLFAQLVGVHGIGLGHNRDDRLVALKPPAARRCSGHPGRSSRLPECRSPAHPPARGCRPPGRSGAHPAECGGGEYQGVHQNQLVLVLVHNTADRVAGRLRTVRGDSHLLTNHKRSSEWTYPAFGRPTSDAKPERKSFG